MAETYHVLPNGQRTRTILSPTGTGFLTVREITFQVDSGPAKGTVDTVQVAADFATVDTVRLAIEDRIAHLDGVARLGGGLGGPG